MKQQVSPAVMAIVIIVVVAVVGLIGYKMMSGGGKSSDQVDPQKKAQYEQMSKNASPITMDQMAKSGGRGSGGQLSGGSGH